MTKLRNDSDSDWESFGRSDPYYAVLTEDRYRASALTDEHRAAFFRSGEEHVSRIFAIIREHLMPAFAPRRALDYGCGVGRVVLPLARVCSDVTGVDVSPAMLAEARRNCDRAHADNVHLVLADDALSRVDTGYDFIHSYIVLQHIPVHRGEAIVRELLARLAPDGVAMLHVTYAHANSALGRALYWSRTRIPGAHVLLNVVLGRHPRTPIMQGNDYSLTRLIDMMRELGCADVHVRFSSQAGNSGALLFCRRVVPEPFT